ncbi:MAG: hypothetical protein LBK52_01395 [Deltaproteobacteria bacterium]|jgi:hypothetical protein|nr:hypothetical protein [Deltaproteobacteria bacterium]
MIDWINKMNENVRHEAEIISIKLKITVKKEYQRMLKSGLWAAGSPESAWPPGEKYGRAKNKQPEI